MFANPTPARRYVYGALAGGLLLLLAGSLPLQIAATPAGYRPMLLVMVAAGLALAVPAGLGLTWLELAALRRPALQGELHDELSVRNSVRAMAVGYAVLVVAGALALPLIALTRAPGLPVLTAVVLIGILAHVASFAWFERQGDDD